jgi:hypothetical protein
MTCSGAILLWKKMWKIRQGSLPNIHLADPALCNQNWAECNWFNLLAFGGINKIPAVLADGNRTTLLRDALSTKQVKAR